MRSAQTILGLVTSVCVTLTPAYADSHKPAGATPRVHLPQTAVKPTTTGKSSTTTSTTTRSSTASSATLNPIAQKISSHPQLASKVNALLPAGTTLNQASAHFRNQGQFLAALHVSRNLGIPFSNLKADMTGAKHLSLGQSIQDLKPRANATTEARHAEAAADHDVKATTTTTLTNSIAQSISSRPQLASRVRALLPTGMTLNQASNGFKNQGQ